jgi:hypothetical protein
MAEVEEFALERTTVFLHHKNIMDLDELRFKLRRRGINVRRSKVIRAAVNWLLTRDIEEIIKRLQLEHD